MKIFFAGATGAIGRILLPRLTAAGHDVTAMTRSEERAASLRAAGTVPVVCDALDEAAVRRAVGQARPDAIFHQLTALPRRIGGGPYAVYTLCDQRGASNAKAKRELGWSPRFQSWREGFRAMLNGFPRPRD